MTATSSPGSLSPRIALFSARIVALPRWPRDALSWQRDHIVKRNYAELESNPLDNVVNMFKATDEEEYKNFTFARISAGSAARTRT